MKLRSFIPTLVFLTAFGFNSLTYPINAQEPKKTETSIVEQKKTLSDLEHAKYCKDVVYQGSEVLQVGSSDREKKYVVIDGNVFSHDRWIPDMHIRPIDGNQTLYVKGNVEYSFKDLEHSKPEFAIKTNIPLIFNSDIVFDTLIIDGQEIDTSKLEVSKDLSKTRFRIDLKNLVKKGCLGKSALEDKKVDVQYSLRIKLNEYKIRQPSEFGTFEQLKKLAEEHNLPLLVRRYTFLEERVAELEKDSPHNYSRAVFEFTRNALEYENKELRLSKVEAIKQGKGDCDDYTGIMVDLLKYEGVPAVEGNAYIRDIDEEGNPIEGSHVFPIFALPLKDGSLTWILSDPTWASGESNPDEFFQQKDRCYLLDLEIKVDNMNLRGDNLKYVTKISAGKPVKGDLGSYKKLHDKLDSEKN